MPSQKATSGYSREGTITTPWSFDVSVVRRKRGQFSSKGLVRRLAGYRFFMTTTPQEPRTNDQDGSDDAVVPIVPNNPEQDDPVAAAVVAEQPDPPVEEEFPPKAWPD